MDKNEAIRRLELMKGSAHMKEFCDNVQCRPACAKIHHEDVAAFIVSSHNALPALLDDADRMEAELAQMRARPTAEGSRT
jgi:hypothetical protein